MGIQAFIGSVLSILNVYFEWGGKNIHNFLLIEQKKFQNKRNVAYYYNCYKYARLKMILYTISYWMIIKDSCLKIF